MKNERERPHYVSGQVGAFRVIFAQKRESAIVPPDPSEKPTVPVDILSNRFLKNTLRIDYKKCLPCFCFFFVCVVVTAISGGFLGITHQTNGGIWI